MEFCLCDDGFNIPHEHVLAPALDGQKLVMKLTGEIRIPIDWFKYAEALAKDEEDPQ